LKDVGHEMGGKTFIEGNEGASESPNARVKRWA
jgi:hypothetical protein